MRFNGSAAWDGAMRLVGANREMLAIIAGVFIFLPGVIAAYFLGGSQQQMAQQIAQQMAGGGMGAAGGPGDTAARLAMLHTFAMMFTQILPWMLALTVVQTLGELAMLALLTDRTRPTVGEALILAMRALPTFLGVLLLLFLGYLVVGFGVGLVLAVVIGLFTVVHLQALGAGLAIVVALAVLAIVVTRLSLILPVIVIDGVRGPWEAIRRSWAQVKGNTRRLFVFYLLLLIVYVVLAGIIGAMSSMVLVMLAGRETSAFFLANGIVSGLIGSAATIIGVALLAAIHRQIGGAAEAVADTFA